MFLLLLVVLLRVCSVLSYDLSALSITGDVDGGTQLAMQDTVSAYLLVSQSSAFTLDLQASSTVAATDIESGAVDFATASGGLSDEQAATWPTLTMYPILCSALLPIYRLDALGAYAPQLVLSRAALASIYLGEITWWNDTQLQATNSVILPEQRIVMILPAANSSRNTVWTTALGKFSSNFSSSIPVSDSPVWPYSDYYQWQVHGGTSGQATAVIATDGSIGFAFQSVALQMNNNVAAMINLAGATVQATSNSITFAAVELGTQQRSRPTAATDLTDGSGSGVWPIALMSFLLIDTQYSPQTCHVRAAILEFWQWFYTSAVVAGLIAARQYAPVPSIVLSELAVSSSLVNDIYCRGDLALPAAVTTTRIIGAPQVSFVSGLLANLYNDVDESVQWAVQTDDDQVTLQQLLQAEIDVAFINPDNVDADLMQAVIDDTAFLLLPTYLLAPSVAYNPQLTATVNIAAYQVTMTTATIALILWQCLTNWNDPRLLAQNPWLESLLPTLADSPVPITAVLGCGTAPITLALMNAVDDSPSAVNDTAFISCMDNFLAGPDLSGLQSCTTPQGENVLYVADEAAIPAMILGVQGSVGVMLFNADPTYGFVQVTDLRDGVWVNTTASVAGMTACVIDNFDADEALMGEATQLSATSHNPQCYGPTQQVMAVTRSEYSSAATDSSGCGRGYNTLQLLQWFYSTTLIDALVNSVGVARVNSASPSIQSAYTAALTAVTCDNATLLSTAADKWTLTASIGVFVDVLAAIGLVCCALLCAFMWYNRRHPVIRFASPPFLFLSLSGVAFLFVSALLLVRPVSSMACSAFSWLLNVGLMVTFAPLFAKTWRIYRIFGREKLAVVAISNRRLLLLCIAILSMEVTLLSIWQAAGNLQPIADDVTTSQQVTLAVSLSTPRFVVDEYLQCGVPAGAGRAMFAIIAVEKCFLFFFGALMAFSTRKVSSTFNESSGITLAIYNVCFTVGIIAPIILVVSAVGDVLTLLLAFALLWIAYFTCGILSVPKLMQIVHQPKDDGRLNPTVQASSSSQSGYVFMSLAALSTLAMLQAYQAALQTHLAQVTRKVAQLKSGGSALAVATAKPSIQPSSASSGGHGRGVGATGSEADERDIISANKRGSRSVPNAPSVSGKAHSSLSEVDHGDGVAEIDENGGRLPRVRRLMPANSVTNRNTSLPA